MMVSRTFNHVAVLAATNKYREDIANFYPDEWVANDQNVALTNEYGDIALFERQYLQPNCVCGHYFFDSRGKQARAVAKEFLKEIFTGPYDVEAIIGLTPIDNKGALWMNRQLGFKQQDVIDTSTGPCALVLLTKKEWVNE